MKQLDISEAKDPDLRSAMTALLRASMLARKAAMDSGTDLVIVKDGQLMFVQVKMAGSSQPEDAQAQ
jgi:hypothetical protein